MRYIKWVVPVIVFLAFVLRMLYCWDLPLSGDESVSLLQAAGKATEYGNYIPAEPTSIEKLRALMEYSPEFGPADVLDSMEKAGMHPPAYYLLLHYVMKYAGNSTFLMRLISVFFASVSVFILYLIGKKIVGITCGVSAALFLAVSTYGVHFALLVRPYPLVMFLSLLSTWFLILYLENTDKKQKFLYFVLFLLSAALGLYLIYLFAFVFMFQVCFLVLYEPRNLKHYLMAGATCVVIFLFYTPWLPRFLNQFHVVRSGNYYFSGKSSLPRLFEYLFSYNFSEFFPGTYAWYKFLFLALVLVVGILGVISLSRTRFGRTLLLSTAIYVCGYYLADLLLNMRTLNAAHFMFFLIPVFFLVLAAGIHFMCTRRFVCILSGTFLTLILTVNLLYSFESPRTFDGPHCLKNFSQSINTLCKDSKGLILMNNPGRRFLLSTISPLQALVDVVRARDAHYDQALEDLEDSTVYDWLFVPLYEQLHDGIGIDEKSLQEQKEKLKLLGYDEFETIKSPVSKKTRMLIFRNQRLNPESTGK